MGPDKIGIFDRIRVAFQRNRQVATAERWHDEVVADPMQSQRCASARGLWRSRDAMRYLYIGLIVAFTALVLLFKFPEPRDRNGFAVFRQHHAADFHPRFCDLCAGHADRRMPACAAADLDQSRQATRLKRRHRPRRRPARRKQGGADPRRSGPAGRRLARRLHLGRARPPAGGAVAALRRHFRHVGGRHERRGHGLRADAGRARRSARRARRILEARIGCRADESPAARSDRDPHRQLDARLFAGVRRRRIRGAGVLALRHQPGGPNPLTKILAESVDFAHLVDAPIKLFVTATNVHTGRGRIFRNAELTPDVLLASACLPTMFQAVEIDGVPYWDGGYAGNPSMSPLIRECTASDTILVQINPIERPGTPRTAREIQNRLNEISFNATLLKELKAGALLRQVADPGTGEGAAWAHHAGAPHFERGHARAGLLFQDAHRVAVLHDAAGRRPQVGHGVSRRAPFRSGRALDARPRRNAGRNLTGMGLIGILLGLGALVWLSFRGWSVLVLAPVAALIVALAAREPLLANWTMTFMGSAAGFILQFFPLFLLGAVFGKLMDDSGSVTAIARFMTEKLGPRRAMLAVVLAGALVTYGGVSLFVAFFVLVPMGQALFRAADIPNRLMPAAIALGTMTFTMSALPGTPAIQNAIPDAVLRDHAVRRARARHRRLGHHAGVRPVVAGARGKVGTARGRRFWRRGRRSPMRPPANRRFASARQPRAASIRRNSPTATTSDSDARHAGRGVAAGRGHRGQSGGVAAGAAAPRLELPRATNDGVARPLRRSAACGRCS